MTLQLPGTYDIVITNDNWLAQARIAATAAAIATDYEGEDYAELAKDQWKKIFGSYTPI